MAVSQRRASLVRRLRSRKTRERERAVLVEGVRAVTEALGGEPRVRFAAVSARFDATPGAAELRRRLSAAGVVADVVEDDELAELSDTEHHQGILMVCAEPETWSQPPSPAGRYLVLDAVQDPGNAGTLVRAATAFGLDAVISLDGTVDLWGAKAVRASAGMAFRMPMAMMTVEALATATSAAGVRLLVADAAGDDVAHMGGGTGFALVVGNEGTGVREKVRQLAAGRVGVPMLGPAESLNVGMAGAILLYALTRETILG